MFKKRKQEKISPNSILQHYFDKRYYVTNNKDIKEIDIDPFEHYKIFGSKEGRNPNRWFDVDYYLENNSDIILNDDNNPFLHYLIFGWKEKRLPNAYTSLDFYDSITSLDEINSYFTEERIVEQERKINLDSILQHYFDKRYYVTNNKDIKEIDIDPFEHYKIFGSKEGRNPNRWFDVDYYLENNSDIILNDDNNPFLHYLIFGWKEKRLPNAYTSLDFYDSITSLDEINSYFTEERIVEQERKINLDKSIDSINSIRAHIDRYDSSTLIGWAYDSDQPNKRLLLEILIDEKVVGEIIADQYRPDLQKLFNSDGKYGFFFKMENSYTTKKLGLVTLREKGSANIILTNSFSIKYDLTYFFGNEEKTSDTLSRNLSPEFNLAIEYYHAKEFEKAKQFIETSLKKNEQVPDILYIYLLKIYFSERNYVSIIELYTFIIKNNFLKHIYNAVHEELLSFCSSLWMMTPDEHLVTEDVHKLEILLVILEEARFLHKELFLEKSQDMHKFLALLVKSAILIDKDSIEKLFYLIVENAYYSDEPKKELGLYIDNLPFIELLLNSIHTVDNSKLNEINLHIYSLGEHSNNIFIKELFSLYLIYIEVLINLKQLNQENTESTIRLIQKEISKSISNDDKLNIIYIDLFYILGDFNKSISLFSGELGNIINLDWKCKYLPEVLWLYFKDSGYRIDNDDIMKFVYHRYQENRATYIENIIILVDINRYKEFADLTILYSVVKNLILDSFTENNKEISLFVKNLLNKLLYGTVDTYLDNSLKLKNYFSGIDNKLSMSFHDSELFELQNLYYLSILNSRKDFTLDTTVDKKYKGLLTKEKRNTLYDITDSKQEEKTIAVLAVVNDMHEEQYISYYKSMLQFSRNKSTQIYLYFSEYYYLLEMKGDTVSVIKGRYEDKKAINALSESNCDMYMILNQDSIVHHNLLNTVKFDTNTYYTSLEQGEYSFFVTHKQFKYFQYIIEHDIYENMFDYILDLRRKLGEYAQLDHVEYIKGQQGILSFQNIETGKIKLLTNYEYTVFALDDVKKSLAYLTDLYLDKRIDNIININIGDVSIDLLKSFIIEEREDDLACFLVQRNEYLRLEGFLTYYRELGVDKFYIIDNASDDGKTLDYLLNQEDVEVYSTVQAYSQSLFGVKWIELLIQAKRVGKWNIVVDADELLLLSKQFSTFKDQCNDLEKSGYDSLYTPFLDMYSDVPIRRTAYAKGRDILKTCIYYDKHFYTFFTPHGGNIGNMNTYQGGLRSRTFGLNSVVLNKLPLFKFNSKHKLREGLHWIDNASPAYGKSVLLHFKYIETFHQYVISEIKRGQHWNGASEYWQYYHFLTTNPEFSFYNATLSKKFTSVEEFYKNMFSPFKLKEKVKNV